MAFQTAKNVFKKSIGSYATKPKSTWQAPVSIKSRGGGSNCGFQEHKSNAVRRRVAKEVSKSVSKKENKNKDKEIK